jgi:hypothetical protein
VPVRPVRTPVEDPLAAEDFLDCADVRPNHDFDAAGVKGEIEKRATGEA